MDRYKIIGPIGDGTFGTVLKAVNIHTGEIVAIKRIKKEYFSWEEGIDLKEVRVMMLLKHPNIVATKEIIRENNTFFFVMEYMDQNLYEYIQEQKSFLSEDTIRKIMYQVFQGLAYLHKSDIFHRDIKPENLLLRNGWVKIGDFGLARKSSSQPPYTEYISTRWYRAPEILLRSKRYNSAVDIWAAGCIMAELMLLSPLFPGVNEEDEIVRICHILGSPTDKTWKEGMELANQLHFKFPDIYDYNNLQRVFPNSSENARKLLSKLLVWNPDERLTASEALCEPFFTSSFRPY